MELDALTVRQMIHDLAQGAKIPVRGSKAEVFDMPKDDPVWRYQRYGVLHYFLWPCRDTGEVKAYHTPCRKMFGRKSERTAFIKNHNLVVGKG